MQQAMVKKDCLNIGAYFSFASPPLPLSPHANTISYVAVNSDVT